jgi:hypothetical protein
MWTFATVKEKTERQCRSSTKRPELKMNAFGYLVTFPQQERLWQQERSVAIRFCWNRQEWKGRVQPLERGQRNLLDGPRYVSPATIS